MSDQVEQNINQSDESLNSTTIILLIFNLVLVLILFFVVYSENPELPINQLPVVEETTKTVEVIDQERISEFSRQHIDGLTDSQLRDLKALATSLAEEPVLGIDVTECSVMEPKVASVADGQEITFMNSGIKPVKIDFIGDNVSFAVDNDPDVDYVYVVDMTDTLTQYTCVDEVGNSGSGYMLIK